MMNRLIILAALCLALMTSCSPKTSEWTFDIPDGYLDEREDIPAFWKTTTSEEKPDIIMSMHTGVSRNDYFMEMLQPSAAVYPPMLFNVWRDFFTQVHTALTLKGLKKTMDVEKETTPKPKKKSGCLNMTGALAFHCGALSVTVEAPSHGYAGVYDGTPVQVSPEKSLTEQLTAHQAAMEFLSRKGGVAIWEKEYNN